MRKEVPVLADIYPAGTKSCEICGDTNLSGEGFMINLGVFSNGSLCPDCYKVKEDMRKEEEKETYASGEAEPCDTDEVTCPWCGYEQSDSWELVDSDDEYECMDCNKVFSYEREFIITYSSNRAVRK